jgi:hypothetical protein
MIITGSEKKQSKVILTTSQASYFYLHCIIFKSNKIYYPFYRMQYQNSLVTSNNFPFTMMIFCRFLLLMLLDAGPVSAGCYLQQFSTRSRTRPTLVAKDGILSKPVQRSTGLTEESTENHHGKLLYSSTFCFIVIFIIDIKLGNNCY